MPAGIFYTVFVIILAELFSDEIGFSNFQSFKQPIGITKTPSSRL